MALLDQIDLVVGLVSLFIISITYLKLRRMDRHQIEAQLARRFDTRLFRFDPGAIEVTDVRVYTDGSVANFFRKYPVGRTEVELTIKSPTVDPDTPWSDSDFSRHCENEDTEAEYFVQDATSDMDDNTAMVMVTVHETDPDAVYAFVRRLTHVVKGEPNEALN